MIKTILAAVAALVVVVLVVRNFEKIRKFVMEVRVELTKVSWSTPRELAGSTTVVIVVTVIMAVFIFVIDSVLSKALRALFS